MEDPVKVEIINAYKKLINDCKKALINKVDIEKNQMLIIEYKNVLNQIQ